MKIVVSKKAIEKSMITKVNATIWKAKQCAENGQTSFWRLIPEEAGYTKGDFINKVEELTEHTVYVDHRATFKNSIKFSIAQEGRIYG